MKQKKTNKNQSGSNQSKNDKPMSAQKTAAPVNSAGKAKGADMKSGNMKAGGMMGKKVSATAFALFFSVLSFSQMAHAEQKVTTTEQSTTQTTTVPRNVKKDIPASTTTTTSATVTKESEPKLELDSRTVLDEEMLKKMSATLCSDGFKAYVGSDKHNICQNQAVAPDLAYSCVWDKDGTAAYAPTPQGPCNLDFTEHKGNVIVTKTEFNNPPLPYGTQAECCYRAAQGYKKSN